MEVQRGWGHVAALADARHMSPQALADWLARWPRRPPPDGGRPPAIKGELIPSRDPAW